MQLNSSQLQLLDKQRYQNKIIGIEQMLYRHVFPDVRIANNFQSSISFDFE